MLSFSPILQTISGVCLLALGLKVLTSRLLGYSKQLWAGRKRAGICNFLNTTWPFKKWNYKEMALSSTLLRMKTLVEVSGWTCEKEEVVTIAKAKKIIKRTRLSYFKECLLSPSTFLTSCASTCISFSFWWWISLLQVGLFWHYCRLPASS